MARGAGNPRWRTPAGAEGLSPPTDSGCPLDDNRMAEIEATFGRIHRPLRWPMEHFRRRYVSNKSFVGYRFSRIGRSAHAGFSFGFALRDEVYPGVSDPPEVLAYAFVEPKGSTLYDFLVTRKGSAFRRLAALSRRMGFPFELNPNSGVAAVRHRSVRRVPKEIFVFVASDFLMLCYQPIRASGFLERVTKATTGPG